ncbi:MAG: zf-HC2 domain-containing protein [Armatimonadetes bacterium]|nr:zf-HC2 domain-containing protein [Armatimonadota bacterium]
MFGCGRIADLLGAYVYGDLTSEEMRKVEQHTESCAACARDLKSRERAVALVPNELPKLSDEEKQRIMWTVSGAVRPREQREAPRISVWSLAKAAAVTVIVVVAFVTGANYGQRSVEPKVIVKEVPQQQAPAQTQLGPENTADPELDSGPAETIDKPVAVPRRTIASDSFRRDRLRETYRRNRARRNTVRENAPAIDGADTSTGQDASTERDALLRPDFPSSGVNLPSLESSFPSLGPSFPNWKDPIKQSSEKLLAAPGSDAQTPNQSVSEQPDAEQPEQIQAPEKP